MFNFHYNTIKRQYPGEKSQLCFTDMDSFLYRINTTDIYTDMIKNYQQYDFSDYPDTHPCFNEYPIPTKYIQSLNKKVVGKFKDEEQGHPIIEFVGMRAKCYSYLRADGYNPKLGKECKKLKGIVKSAVKRNIHHDHYKKCLFDNEYLHTHMNTFRSYNHQVKTIRQCKSALVNFDDKRYTLSDGIHTLAHGLHLYI